MQKVKYDIEFPNPFWIGLEIVESDERLHSIGCRISMRLELPRGKFEYKANDIWIACSVLDEFERNLKVLYSGKNIEARLYDIDREVIYSFNREKITASVHRIHSEKGSGYMEFVCDFDRELVSMQIECIGKFAKWW